MHRLSLFGVLVAIIAFSSLASHSAAAAPAGAIRLQKDGAMFIAGRSVRCGNIRNVLDRNLPSEGAAGHGVLVINPSLIGRMPQIVRLFVFHHECGHHNIGDSELRADCWAVDQGVKGGWLDKAGLNQVCRSFGNMPETSTHPSGKRRCQNLNSCYATALQKHKGGEEVKQAANSPPSNPPLPQRATRQPAPTLVSGPTLIGKGDVPAAASPISDPPAAFAPH
jgi:hypothetical protein